MNEIPAVSYQGTEGSKNNKRLSISPDLYRRLEALGAILGKTVDELAERWLDRRVSAVSATVRGVIDKPLGREE